MVRIENPEAGKRSQISTGAALDMIAMGAAIATASVDGVVTLIRLTEAKRELRRSTAREYDAVPGPFFAEAGAIPIVAAAKMIREERSSRDWSYSTAVRRNSVAAVNGT